MAYYIFSKSNFVAFMTVNIFSMIQFHKWSRIFYSTYNTLTRHYVIYIKKLEIKLIVRIIKAIYYYSHYYYTRTKINISLFRPQ